MVGPGQEAQGQVPFQGWGPTRHAELLALVSGSVSVRCSERTLIELGGHVVLTRSVAHCRWSYNQNLCAARLYRSGSVTLGCNGFLN